MSELQPYIESAKPNHSPNAERRDRGTNAKIDILFVDHSPDNVGHILHAMTSSSAEIIAMELVGSLAATRTLVQSKINEAIHTPDPRRRSAIMQGVSQHFRDIAWALAGSEKNLVFIDLPSDDPRYTAIDAAKKLRLAAQNTTATQDDHDSYVQAFAHSIAVRDAALTQQLIDIHALNPDKDILAVMGAAHEAVGDLLTHSTKGEATGTMTYLPRFGEEIVFPSHVAKAMQLARRQSNDRQ